jgi:hypothetical protein
MIVANLNRCAKRAR